MPGILKYSQFRLTESESENEYSLDQIQMAVDFLEDDLVDIFFVPDFDNSAISIYCDLDAESGSISTEVSADLEYYTIDYDKNDLSKLFRSSLRDAADASTAGPKFSLPEILEAAESLLDDEAVKNYIEDIDLSDAEYSLREMGHSMKGLHGVFIAAEFDTTAIIRVEKFNVMSFKDDLIKKLVSDITKKATFGS